VGAGSSQEAEFILQGPIPAGTYTLVADGIITGPVDVLFELIWRKGDGTGDVLLAMDMHHFEPNGGGNFDAVPYEVELAAPAVDAVAGAGDQFIFRYTGTNSPGPMSYAPNGDGATRNGRIPNITLP
jgi:hypothetical protein